MIQEILIPIVLKIESIQILDILKKVLALPEFKKIAWQSSSS